MTFAQPYIAPDTRAERPRAIVIGAGVGGLASAIRLAAAGYAVTVVERHGHAGGKIRTVPSAAGPIDAGPTVLTMRHVFDQLFALAGARLDDHVTLIPQPLLARHFWSDGATLDLFADRDASAAAVRTFAGARAERQFVSFCRRAAALFEAFDAPMMQSARPSQAALFGHVLRSPSLIPRMAPLSTLAAMLRRHFDNPRLAQLFGRYATYVGGSPLRSPAVLALIWQSEASGVWVVRGGMHRLAGAMAELAAAQGVAFRLSSNVERIEIRDHRATGVVLEGGASLSADAIVFNGDPRALAVGALGAAVSGAAPATLLHDRSHSARVHSFAARVTGPEIAHHNVFFGDTPWAEFRDLARGRVPEDPTLYLCAEDRGQGQPPPSVERFEMIANAPATDTPRTDHKELSRWHRKIMQRMATFGMTFSPMPEPTSVTTAEMFADLFPESLGALYGQSPHGLMAAFQRPTARTIVPGLYLAGGGTHPGAGVPMATLSARHAVEAILSDRTSPSMSAQTAMPGGMSTG